MINYDITRKVLLNDMTHDLYKNRCTALLKIGLAYEELNKYDNFSDILSEDDFKLEIRFKQNRKNKRNRTKKHLMEIIRFKNALNGNGTLVFGTCTLNDKTLSFKSETIDKKINFWIKKHFLWALVNIDYGKKNERKHYHFIGITTELIEPVHQKSKKGYDMYNLTQKDYEMGWEPDLLKIDFSKNDIDKTINYLLKLNNHSNKDTTSNRVRVIKKDIVKLFTEDKRKKLIRKKIIEN